MAQQSSLCVVVTILLSLQIVVSTRTNLLHGNPKTLTFELKVRRHHNVSKTKTSFPVRTREDVQQSHDRAAYFAHRRNGGASTEALQSPVSASSGGGEFVMKIQLGTPPKPFNLIMDTGSDLNWIQCKPCNPCFKQPSPLFDPAASSTYDTVSCKTPLCTNLGDLGTCGGGNVCNYHYFYGDGSETYGNMGTDVLTYDDTDGGTSTFPKLTFGCAHASKGNFAVTDGLVGLGKGPLSLNSQLASALPNKFAYCMVDRASGKTSSLVLGDVPASGLAYTKMLYSPQSPTFYAVELQDIEVNGKALNIPQGGFGKEVIFDSGTTLTILWHSAFEAVAAAVASVVSYRTVSPDEGAPLELCWDVGGVESPVFPSLTFHFGGGAVFHMTPANNIFVLEGDFPLYCFAMTTSPADQEISIIGNSQQIDHLVVYDNEAGRIGFVSRTC